MIYNDKRLNIIIGAYGSGKSEISVNFARLMKESNPEQKVLLADLDIVNPFYRSADAARKLNDSDIRVIFPSYANSNETKNAPLYFFNCLCHDSAVFIR